MMTRYFATALLSASLLLGACDRPAEPAPRKEIRVRSAGQDQLFNLDDLGRAIALKRAIVATGSVCKRIVSSGFVGGYKNMDMWTARCDNDREGAVFVAPDDSVQVRLCRDTEAVGLPACEARPGTEGGDGVMSNQNGATNESGPA
ncbi:MAG: hypothetical protein M3Q57_08490 [Pseudomonadota bacterium]|nr:hypothetical protein [Pseudomonadota bacterium]